MELLELYRNNYPKEINNSIISPKISFEIFPPSDGNIANIFEEMRFLKKYNPVLISLSFDSTNHIQFDLIKALIDLEFNVLPQLSGTKITKELAEHYLVQIENLGIENILTRFNKRRKNVDDFNNINEFNEFIYQKTTLSIGVNSEDYNDITTLKKSITSGVSAIFIQPFLDIEKTYKYIETLKNINITIPVIASIIPIQTIKHFELLKTDIYKEVPKKLIEKFEKSPNDIQKIGIEYTIKQCQELIDFGIDGLHFITMNKAKNVSEIIENII